MNNYSKIKEALGTNRVLENEILSKYCSVKIGGTADLFFRATNSIDLITAIKEAGKNKIPFFILGGGTNILVSDNGYRGLVIKNESSLIKMIGMKGLRIHKKNEDSLPVRYVFLEVESGVSVNRLVRYCLEQGLSGLEYFLGQPGTVGGAIWINAHNMRMKKYVSDSLVSIKAINSNNKTVEILKEELQFGYDKSKLQKNGNIIISAIFMLVKSEKEKLWQISQEVLDYRKETQPAGYFTFGCTFRNIAKSDAMRIATPNYTCSAGYLLDNLNLKGYQIGQAKFSEKHANFIVHKGGAKASDVLQLITLAKRKAFDKYKIELKEEIQLLGDFNNG